MGASVSSFGSRGIEGTHDHDARQARREQAISEYWRNSVLIGAIGGGAGAAVCVGVGLAYGTTSEVLVVSGISAASVFIAYFGLCAVWLGFEEDIRGLLLRLIGVAAVWCALILLLTPLPLVGVGGGLFRLAMHLALLAGLLRGMTGRGWNDAGWIAGGVIVVRMSLTVVIALVA